MRGQVARGHVAFGDQPLRQAGVQAAGDRVFGDADRRGEGPNFKIRRARRMSGIRRGNTHLVSEVLELEVVRAKA